MKYAIRFFALAVLAAVALTARAQEAVTITGYQPGEFAVKNGIEQLLKYYVPEVTEVRAV